MVDAIQHRHRTEALSEAYDLDHVRNLRSRVRAASEAVWPMIR